MARNYVVCFLSTEVEIGQGFHTKDAALAYAKKRVGVYVKSVKTRQITYMLEPNQCSCYVCGNELEGKTHCPNCSALHYYGR